MAKKSSALMLISLGLYLVLSVLLAVVTELFGIDDYSIVLLLNSLMVSVPAFLIPSLIFRKKVGMPRMSAPKPLQVLLSLIAGVGALYLNSALSALCMLLLGDIQVTSNAVTLTGLEPDTLPVMIIAIAVIPPISEEIFMRGTLLEGWMDGRSPALSILLSAIVFALIHMAPSNIIIYVAIGAVFGIVYYITRNAWLAVIPHFVNNFASLIVSYSSQAMTEVQDTPQIGAGDEEILISSIILILQMLRTAVIFLMPAIFLLNHHAKKRSIGRYAPRPEPMLQDKPEDLPQERGLGGCFWICLAVLVIMNIYSALVEFGVITA